MATAERIPRKLKATTVLIRFFRLAGRRTDRTLRRASTADERLEAMTRLYARIPGSVKQPVRILSRLLDANRPAWGVAGRHDGAFFYPIRANSDFCNSWAAG